MILATERYVILTSFFVLLLEMFQLWVDRIWPILLFTKLYRPKELRYAL